MQPPRRVCVTLLPLYILLAACDNTRMPNQPAEVPATQATATSGSPISLSSDGRQVMMLDQCEPDSFNAAIEPGTCVNRSGGITFDTFIALLQKLRLVPSWRFSPDTIHVPRDLTLSIVNAGGEVHTFTEVAAFGGGFVEDLNDLSGNPVPAPECLAIASLEFVAPGAQTTHTFEAGEAAKYQCCIHPWMRAQTR